VLFRTQTQYKSGFHYVSNFFEITVQELLVLNFG
jgi:hypothetical protein